MSDDAIHFPTRELCPDGACIGVIGPDGRCKECGTVSPSQVSNPRVRGLDAGPDDPDFYAEERELCPDDACIGLIGPDGVCKECGTAAADSTRAEPADQPGDEPGQGPASDAFEDRRLCPDGACIGIIGSDGRCKECGKAQAS